jgi:hypothetical protein
MTRVIPASERVKLAVQGVALAGDFPAAVGNDVVGSVLDVAIPAGTVEDVGLTSGIVVELWARSTPAGLFAHPDRVSTTDTDRTTSR